MPDKHCSITCACVSTKINQLTFYLIKPGSQTIVSYIYAAFQFSYNVGGQNSSGGLKKHILLTNKLEKNLKKCQLSLKLIHTSSCYHQYSECLPTEGGWFKTKLGGIFFESSCEGSYLYSLFIFFFFFFSDDPLTTECLLIWKYKLLLIHHFLY